jgi:hypothetical protein
MHELDLWCQSRMMQGSHQIRGKHKATLEDRDNQQILRLSRCNGLRNLGITLGNGLFIEKNTDATLKRHEKTRKKQKMSRELRMKNP